MPRPMTGDDAKNKKITDLFNRWVSQCDADGQLDFYGLQTLAVREMIEGGEVIIRRRWRRTSDGLSVPVQIQLLEADHIDDTKVGILGNGNSAVGGIEFNAFGQRTAYWLFREHPGSAATTLTGTYESAAVPASEIAHLYEKQRTQARGAPWMSPVIRRIRDVDDYDFAEGIRKKIEASTVAIVVGEEEAEEGVAPRVEDSRGNIVEKFAPGLIAYLRGGKDVRFNAPATVGGYEEYKRVTAREISTGLRVPYELLTNDLSTVNFSSSRVGLVEFRRMCRVFQWQVVIPMFLEPCWRWFCEAAWTAGQIDSPEIPVEWAPPKWEAIEPYKDALANMIMMRTGQRSWQDIVSEGGRDPQTVIDDIAWFNQQMDAKGITLDSDPRRTSMKGALQKLLPDQEGQSLSDGSGQSVP